MVGKREPWRPMSKFADDNKLADGKIKTNGKLSSEPFLIAESEEEEEVTVISASTHFHSIF
jgi:hypothetical protein